MTSAVSISSSKNANSVTSPITTTTSTTSSASIQPLFTPIVNMTEGNSELLTTLLRVAMCRLLNNGKLVLWLPTQAKTEETVVKRYLEALLAAARAKDTNTTSSISTSIDSRGDVGATSADSKPCMSSELTRPMLRLERVTAEMLNDGLWRWLCVFKLDEV